MAKVLKYSCSFWKKFSAVIFLSASLLVSGQEKLDGGKASKDNSEAVKTAKDSGKVIKSKVKVSKDSDQYIRSEAKDIQSTEKFQAGLKKFKAKDYVGAADKFLDAEFLSRSISMKAAAAKEAMKCYRKANLLYKEFVIIERLLNSYPAEVDFGKLVDREYAIADKYYNGHRDPEFWSLRWIPWLVGPDRSEEMLKKALKHAPYASTAPQAKLRLAVLLIEGEKVKEGLKELRELIKSYPDSKYCKFAYLELGNALFELSLVGDGDGKYNNEALSVFKEFIKKYPEAAEIDWIKKCQLRSKDIQAKRLLGIAEFYKRIGRTAPAERYLNDILVKYPDSKSADKSEEMLSQIDKTYIPEGFRPELKSRYQKYDVIPIPRQASRIIMVPENSNGKYLYPIRDLGIKKRKGKDGNEDE